MAGLLLVLVVGFLIMAEAKEQIENIEGLNDSTNYTECIGSYACNGTSTLQEAMDTIPGWVPLIVIGVIGAILLSLIGLYRK